MPDIAAISGALGALKTATEVVKVIRDLDTTLQTADLKLKIADLTDALANAKLAIVEIQDELGARECEIQRLNDALRTKEDVVRYQDAYYKKNHAGVATGDPFCSYCFELMHTLVHINQSPKDRSQSNCPNCKNVFHWQRRQNPDAQQTGA